MPFIGRVGPDAGPWYSRLKGGDLSDLELVTRKARPVFGEVVSYYAPEQLAMEFAKFILDQSLYFYAADPTRSGKYVLWLAKIQKKSIRGQDWHAESELNFPEDILKVRDSLKLFEARKHLLSGKKKDINYYKTFAQFYEEFVSKYQAELDEIDNERALSVLEEFYEDDDYIVYKVGMDGPDKKERLRLRAQGARALRLPHAWGPGEFDAKQKALMHISQPTNWCTRYPDQSRSYMNRDDLYIFYEKKNIKGESPASTTPSYLLHTHSTQFMDVKNVRIPLSLTPNVPFLDIRVATARNTYGARPRPIGYRVYDDDDPRRLSEDELDIRAARLAGEIPWSRYFLRALSETDNDYEDYEE